VKLTNSLIITLIGLVCLTVLGLRNDMDVSMAISGVVLSYVGSRGALKGTGMIAASRKLLSDPPGSPGFFIPREASLRII
jgi:hypothetical protein